jgi:hypothetical protein
VAARYDSNGTDLIYFNISIPINPVIAAVVVAMAGIIFPATRRTFCFVVNLI